MKKGIIVIIVFAIVVALVLLGFGGYLISVRIQSKKYNLVSPKVDKKAPEIDAAEDDFIQLSDVKVHYVRYGTGSQPLLLLHGNGSSCKALSELARYFADTYSVYCLDTRCHGQSSDPGVITYDLMAKDVYEFIQAKLTVKPFVIGHSDGAITALSLASLYPDSVGAIVSCGANSRPETFKFYFTWTVRINNFFHKNKLNDLMLTLPDFTPEFLGRITAPTYVVAGEYDIMPLSDTVYIHERIANSEIAIVRTANHSNYISKNGGKIYLLAREFFGKQAQNVPINA